jgi:FkbM family methyltransferase
MTAPSNRQVEAVRRLIDEHALQLTLVDVGAAGDVYPPFRPLLDLADLVSIDPDARDFQTTLRAGGRRDIRINEAIIDSESATSVAVHMTKNPYCSSTLLPDFSRLNNFTYPDFFEIVETRHVPATSLKRIAAQHQITAIDWLKLDTQGTELRILRSLEDGLLENLVCCDIEISLYAHYFGADVFSQLHEFFDGLGFWITDLACQSRLRMRKSDLSQLTAAVSTQQQSKLQESLKKCPTTLELRYLRSVPANDSTHDIQRYLKLWVLSFFTANYTYCYCIVQTMRERLNCRELCQELESITLGRIEHDLGQLPRESAKQRLRRLAGRMRARLGSR